MNTLILSGYRPVHLLVVALAVLVLTVIGGQVLTHGHRNRADRARKTRPAHHQDAESTDSDPWDPATAITGWLQ